MQSVDIDDLAFQLLELEQKLDSYAALYEEELVEIEDALHQLRKDILTLQRKRQSVQSASESCGIGERSDGRETSDSPSLAL